MRVRGLLAALAAIVAALVWLPVATIQAAQQKTTTTTTTRRGNTETLARMEQDKYRRSVEDLRQQMLGSFDRRKADAARAYSTSTATNYAVYRNGRRNQFKS
jgi:hypothetical protein